MAQTTLTPDSIAQAVQASARRARHKLDAAEDDLNAARASLQSAMDRPDARSLQDAHEQSCIAEHHAHEAAEELEVAQELLAPRVPEPGEATVEQPANHSGCGARSLIPHIKRTR